MKIVDLTHLIEPKMPVFPGTEPPILAQANQIATDGFAEKKITMYSHTGTHMDAPAHMVAGAKNLDSYPAADFFGKAVLLDVRQQAHAYIALEQLLPLELELKQAAFLVVRTGWAELWGKPEYFQGFPALSPEAARWLIDLGIKGIGIDAISIDRMEDHHFPIHYLLFGANLFVVENLAILQELPKTFTLGCFPLYTQEADGAPARVVAWIEE